MTVTQLPSAPDVLLVEAEFPIASPLTVFAHWTEPALLQRWWPQLAEVEPRLGGTYHLSWPQMGWHLRGHYTAFDPGRQLGFTWHWDHDPREVAERVVRIHLEHLSGGPSSRTDLTPDPSPVRRGECACSTIAQNAVELLAAGGTRLLLTHGPYLDSLEDQALRIDDHLAGWQHFLPRLQALLSAPGAGSNAH